jgi:hypothetical protein
MAIARSLHIGVRKPHGIQIEDEVGQSAAADAELMADVASSHGFPDPVLFTADDKTRINAIEQEITAAAYDLAEGGFFLLTFSGHGYQVEAGGSPAAFNQSWVLSDGDLFDQDLFRLFLHFKPGVRILVISDSCHSGTMVAPPGVLGAFSALFAATGRSLGKFFGRRSRFLEAPQVEKLRRTGHEAYAQSKARLAQAQATNGDLKAHVILLAACQDPQEAFVENGHGLFTAKLKVELDALNGQPVSYQDFLDGIKGRIPDGKQIPNFFALSPVSPGFLAGPPFKI